MILAKTIEIYILLLISLKWMIKSKEGDRMKWKLNTHTQKE